MQTRVAGAVTEIDKVLGGAAGENKKAGVLRDYDFS